MEGLPIQVPLGQLQPGLQPAPEIGDLAELRVLDLQYNRDGDDMSGLIGPLPKELSKLTNLVSLNLVHNRFWGPHPGELSALRSLSFLALDYNNFTGSSRGAWGRWCSSPRSASRSSTGCLGACPRSSGS